MFSGSRRSWIALAASLALAGPAMPAFAQRAPARQADPTGRDSAPRQASGQRQLYPQGQGASQGQPKPGGTSATRFPGLPVQRPGAQPVAPRRVVPGFQLNAEDEAVVDLVLQKWEQKNSEIKTFSCEFKLTEFNAAMRLNPAQPAAPIEHKGLLSYAAPDRGMYQVLPSKKDIEDGQHWICDGKAVYEVKDKDEQIIVRPLPEHLQGKAIADAPLPFVFGSTADKMRQRFWIRVSTPERNHTQIDLPSGQVLLEVMPKTQQDAANFKLVQIIFLEPDMTIFAINQFLPNHAPNNQARLMYVFGRPSINSPLERLKNFFIKPENKLGYKTIVEKPPATADEPPARPLLPSANSKNRGLAPLRR
jgi:TIGR03009 family protein